MKNIKKVKKLKKSAKGVTLIALVVTIVVLLILASITISNLTSEKGVIKEARTAKEQTEMKALEEQVELAIINAEKKFRNPTMDNIIEELKNNGIITDESNVDKKTGTITSKLGYVIDGKLDDYIVLSLLEKFEKEVEKFKHPEQSNDNLDRAIGTDGKSVNLDLWRYFKTSDGEGYSLGESRVSIGDYGYYPENVVDGKIKGTVPQYIYIAKEKKVYPVIRMYGTFWFEPDSHVSLKESPKIPDTVIAMECTFGFNSDLTYVEIPNSVEYLGSYIFYGCSSLKSINISSGITNIGNSAFSHCSNLESINIPSSVTNIGNNAFYRCTSLKSINISSSVSDIGERAFAECLSLESINIPSSVNKIGSWAFAKWSSSQTINCQARTRPEGWSFLWDYYDYNNDDERRADLNWGVSM